MYNAGKIINWNRYISRPDYIAFLVQFRQGLYTTETGGWHEGEAMRGIKGFHAGQPYGAFGPVER